MSKKLSKKISALTFNVGQVIDATKCAKIKGGSWYNCCTRNKWVQY